MKSDIPILKGSNQSGLRDYNERLVLSMIQRQGPIAAVDIARNSGLSQQTVSVILRKLEGEKLLTKGDPVRGKVGKPSIPMGLSAEGALSVGLKIGRRSAEVILLDFLGTVRTERRMTYRYPLPEAILTFLEKSLDSILADLPDGDARVAGIGVAMPGQIWSWAETIGATAADLESWRTIDFVGRIATFSRLPVMIDNDATAACRAENTFGIGREYRDFAYFYVGSFVGGGVVLNHSVLEGFHNNAGAFGSLPSLGDGGARRQLIDTASLFLLESDLKRAGRDPSVLWDCPDDWSGLGPELEAWIDTTATHLAQAALTTCAVIDFEAVLVDGAFPVSVRRALVAAMRAKMDGLDLRGLYPPSIEEGAIGRTARSVGAASGPIFARYLLNTHGLFSPQ